MTMDRDSTDSSQTLSLKGDEEIKEEDDPLLGGLGIPVCVGNYWKQLAKDSRDQQASAYVVHGK